MEEQIEKAKDIIAEISGLFTKTGVIGRMELNKATDAMYEYIEELKNND